MEFISQNERSYSDNTPSREPDMKPSTHDWGDIRSALHEPGLEVMERARRLERALSPEHAKEVRRYILEHVPAWAPKSPELPYILARAWMSGELPNLLGVLCEDETLVKHIARERTVWRRAMFVLDSVLYDKQLQVDFEPVSSRLAWRMEKYLDEVGRLTDEIWVGVDGYYLDPYLEHQTWREHKAEILRGVPMRGLRYEDVDEIRPSYLVSLEQGHSKCIVWLSIFKGAYELAFDFEELEKDDIPTSFALLHLGGMLHRQDPNFNFTLSYRWACFPSSSYDGGVIEPECRTFEQMWAVYRRLCL